MAAARWAPSAAGGAVRPAAGARRRRTASITAPPGAVTLAEATVPMLAPAASEDPRADVRGPRVAKAPDVCCHCPVTRLDGADGWPTPAAFLAATVNRYDPTAGRVITADLADADTGDEVVPRTLPDASYRVAVTM